MSVSDPQPAPEPATLSIEGRLPLEIVSTSQLHAEAAFFGGVRNNQVILLQRLPNDYIKATRKNEYWSVSIRRGAIWTLKGFSQEGTTEYSDRKVKESRNAGSLLGRISAAFHAASPANALTTDQVEALFDAYLTGTEFPISPGGGWAG